MSRRSLKRRKLLGSPAQKRGTGHNLVTHNDYARGCGGDEDKYRATRPSDKVVGTGRWLGKGSGVGETVTLPMRGM